KELTSNTDLAALLPDVQIFHKAVDWALRYDEFFDPKQIDFAKKLIAQGQERIKQLRAGEAPWLTQTGLVVRGYRSTLDGSIQPYGLFVPPDSYPNDATPFRLEVWLAGRGDKRSELAFLAESETGPLQFTPSHTIVLRPYGRFCNAIKFAGEVDVFEAMAAVRRQYSIDPMRMIVAGFSMGGASTWHLATHHPTLWCAASPGAGFAETAIYTKALASGKEPPPWWEQKLWNWYNATSYAGNLFNCPTIAYSGEIDPQKESADLMEEAMAKEGLKLERLIGPQTAHKYHSQTKEELAKRLDALANKGREPMPKEIHLTTYTLQYPDAAWIALKGLTQHWERSDVRGTFAGGHSVTLTTNNVTALRIGIDGVTEMNIDGQKLTFLPPTNVDSVTVHKQGDTWSFGDLDNTLRKVPGLTGPIDDAFMSSFIFVRPTGKPLNEKNGAWIEAEMTRAMKMWRDIFRGIAPTKDDTALTGEDIFAKNLILWGDPSSNQVIAKILEGLPIQWTATKLVVKGITYDATDHLPILIFPNPLNPKRYIVLNSGMDFRDDAYGSNALQTPKLPDWAVIDLTTPPGPRWPGKIADAGFFDEVWQMPSKM
ncbi:MAG TPA: prolyl oligopeptidase family serine peptidase, partial [Opitutaceae bacterium]|nr:prolyl oligopeptidase family serine peptidase [Opitutaceae bacterium]